VLCVCSAVQPLDLENLFLFNDGTYTGLQAYKNSKLANVLFAYELSRQLDGTKIKVNVVDPGKYIWNMYLVPVTSPELVVIGPGSWSRMATNVAIFCCC